MFQSNVVPPITLFRFDGESFKRLASSTCDHDRTLKLAKYRGSALTTGSAGNRDCFVKSEIYDFEANQWSDAPDYPFDT